MPSREDPRVPQPSVSSIPLCLTLMLNLRGLAQHCATAFSATAYFTYLANTSRTPAASRHRRPPTPSQSGKKARSRSKGRERRKNNRKKKHDEANPAVAIEAASLQAAENLKGLSIFQFNPTSIATVVEAMMMAFPTTPSMSRRPRRTGFTPPPS